MTSGDGSGVCDGLDEEEELMNLEVFHLAAKPIVRQCVQSRPVAGHEGCLQVSPVRVEDTPQVAFDRLTSALCVDSLLLLW